jgi:hypothetical protein
MFDQAIDSLRKATEATFQVQQELFNKWVGLWPAMPVPPATFLAPASQKKWVEAVGELAKKRREALEAQFSVGLRSIEEAFRLAEAKDPEELRAKTVELWQKAFDFQRQAFETQLQDFQAAAAKWGEPAAKGAA